MPRCAGIKPNGERCTAIVPAPQTHCYQHDPDRADERKRNASRGGRNKGRKSTPKMADLDRQLEDLAAGVLNGEIERPTGAVVNQIINTRIRVVEVERKLKDQEDLEERLAALETILKARSRA